MRTRLLILASGLATAALLASEPRARAEPAAERKLAAVVVSNNDEVLAALAKARPGEVIRLAPGRYYPLRIQGVSFERAVTLAPADPARPAILAGLTIRASGGLVISGLELEVDPAGAANQVQVVDSHDIELSDLSIHGSLNDDPGDDKNGLFIGGSDRVRVTRSEFQQLAFGIIQSQSSHLELSQNYFHDIRSDGITGAGSSFVLISRNYLTNFHFRPGDHPDAVQFFTKNSKEPAHDITVQGNVFIRGSGAAAQGVFLGDEMKNLPYQNVRILDNLFVGSMYNGILVSHAQGLEISGNVVASQGEFTAFIKAFNTEGGKITGNKAWQIACGGCRGVEQSRNGSQGMVSDGGKAVLRKWAADHPELAAAAPAALTRAMAEAGAAVQPAAAAAPKPAPQADALGPPPAPGR